MAKNASFLLLVALFMFGLLSCAIKGRNPLQLTEDDDGSSSESDGTSTYTDSSSSEKGDSSGGTQIKVGPCYDPCPSGACEDNDNCYCSSVHDPNNPFCLPKIKELDSDYSSGGDEQEDGTQINVGPCYDPCPSGTCEDSDKCYCSSEYDPNDPFCLPKYKELGSDYSSSGNEEADTSTSESYPSDDESSSNDGGRQSSDV